MKQMRIRDFGIVPGRMKTGKRNKITDVCGVLIGHATIKNQENHTGVTVILPGKDNAFARKYVAASYVHNGFGKSCGLIQIDELGTLETPIALTNTLNVGVVWDAVAEYVIRQCEKEKVPVKSLNPVVGECNDCQINHIEKRGVRAEHVWDAIACAEADFAEGDVGAGAGTICYGLKGGIGSASRVVEFYGKEYTIGVLVQSNFGATEDFVLDGVLAGERILELKKELDRGREESPGKDLAGSMAVAQSDQGSIMTVLATDLPVSDRQLRRILRRTAVGIARTGAYTGHGSGEVMIGFTTANRVPAKPGEEPALQSLIHESLINRAFQAAAEAAHEAILNSMVCAGRTVGIDGQVYWGLGELLPMLTRPAPKEPAPSR
ncbi:MAG: P1 family peptidase [Lachnospiraceae bacterium]|nr:P1 family peptidase [Lachnospiraceae bacterium]